jgi:MFS family permease
VGPRRLGTAGRRAVAKDVMPGPRASPIERGYRYLVLAASVALVTIGSGGLFLLVVALKPMALEFGWPRSVPAFAYAALEIGAGFGAIGMGYWLDRAGMGWPALAGALAIGAGAVLVSGIAESWQLYLVYGVLLGFLGLGSMLAPLTANILRWFDDRRGMAAGIVTSGQGLAGALWPPIFHRLVEGAGWRQSYFWYGLLAFAALVPLSLLLHRRPPLRTPIDAPAGAPEQRSAAVGGLSANAIQALLCLAMACCCVSMAMPHVHLVAHASDIGHPAARAAEMLSVALAVNFLTRILLVGPIMQRLGGIPTLLLFSAVQALAVLALAFVGSLAALYGMAAVYGLGLGGVIPCYPVIVRETLPLHEAGARTGLVILFGASGMGVGGALGGLIYDGLGGYGTAFVAGAGFNAVNLALVAFLLRATRRTAPAAA